MSTIGPTRIAGSSLSFSGQGYCSQRNIGHHFIQLLMEIKCEITSSTKCRQSLSHVITQASSLKHGNHDFTPLLCKEYRVCNLDETLVCDRAVHQDRKFETKRDTNLLSTTKQELLRLKTSAPIHMDVWLKGLCRRAQCSLISSSLEWRQRFIWIKLYWLFTRKHTNLLSLYNETNMDIPLVYILCKPVQMLKISSSCISTTPII